MLTSITQAIIQFADSAHKALAKKCQWVQIQNEMLSTDGH